MVDTQFTNEEVDYLIHLIEKAEGVSEVHERGIREDWFHDDTWSSELRVLHLFELRLTISRVQFIHRRNGLMTALFHFFLEHCKRNHIREIVVQSVETKAMANWCMKNGFELVYATAIQVDGFSAGDYKFTIH